MMGLETGRWLRLLVRSAGIARLRTRIFLHGGCGASNSQYGRPCFAAACSESPPYLVDSPFGGDFGVGRDLRARRIQGLRPFCELLASISHPGCRMFFSHDHPTRLITPKLSAMAMCKSILDSVPHLEHMSRPLKKKAIRKTGKQE